MATADHQTDADGSNRAHRRSASIAILLNILGMGAGYLYLGRPLRFAMLAGWTLATLAISFHGLWGAIATPIGFVALIAASVLAMLVSIIDASILARRSRQYVLKSYNRAWLYAVPVVVWLGFSMLQSIPALGIERAVQAYVIPSSAMRPTLDVGDQLLADMTAYRRAEPRRGDVAIVRYRGAAITSRIIGLPGERIAVRDGSPVINGVPVDIVDRTTTGNHDRLRREILPGGAVVDVLLDTPPSPQRTMPEVVIPTGHYFVLGDNRDNAADGRAPRHLGGLGFVERSRLLGRASFITWSRDIGRLGMRL